MDTTISRQELLEHFAWDSETNAIRMDGQREVLMGVGSLGELRKSLMGMVGPDQARGVLRRFGYSCGTSDYSHYSKSIEDEKDLLLFGIRLQMLRGHVRTELRVVEADRAEGRFLLEGMWQNSFEADQHTVHFGLWHSPTCWILEGYLSGWASAWFGKTVITLETQCKGMGDAYCLFTAQPADEWGDQCSRFLDDLEEMESPRSISLLEQMAADLRTTQKRLVTSEAKYRALFESAADMMMLCDPMTGRIYDVNRKAVELLGYSRRELLRLFLRDLHPCDQWFRLARVIGDDVDTPAHSLSMTLCGKDQQEYTVEAVFAHIPYTGTIVLQVIFHDVTDFIRTQEALREAQELAHIGQMASAVAHEVRNPLSAIVSGIRLLTSTERSDDERKLIFETITSESERLDSTLNDFLQFARPRSPQHKPVDLKRTITDLLSIIWGDEDAVGSIEYRTEFAEDLPLVECDGDQVRQVLWNVILNGLQAMNKNGTMVLNLKMDNDNHVMIRVTDTGEGIPPEELAKAFEPFHTTKPRGTGLGLPIARRIAHAHGGNIAIESTPGEGTAVTITLPVRKPDGQT